MKKVRISKEYGTFYYEKIMDYDLDAPIYEVYDSNKKFLATCGCYDEVINFIKSGCDENSLYM